MAMSFFQVLPTFNNTNFLTFKLNSVNTLASKFSIKTLL